MDRFREGTQWNGGILPGVDVLPPISSTAIGGALAGGFEPVSPLWEMHETWGMPTWAGTIPSGAQGVFHCGTDRGATDAHPLLQLGAHFMRLGRWQGC